MHFKFFEQIHIPGTVYCASWGKKYNPAVPDLENATQIIWLGWFFIVEISIFPQTFIHRRSNVLFITYCNTM